MRVALIHYWLVTMRGGERVLEALCRLFPQADIYTHVYNPDAVSPLIRSHTVRTTFIQKLPFSRAVYQKYLPFMPLALEQLELRDYDLVISSESGPAKGVLTRSDTTHICYCHSPMRYLWDFYQDYLWETGAITRFLMRPLTHYLRMWDVLAANRVDHFAANSANVAARITKHYRRDSVIIHPPVDVDLFAPAGGVYAAPEDFYLCLGQMVPYKRTDLAVEAFTRLRKPLLVIGQGPDEKRLRAMAGPTVSFAGRLSREDILSAVRHAKALIFPGEEDFGIVPVESMAAGRPVLAYGKGGALETVLEGKTGVLFHSQTPEAVEDAVLRFESAEDSFDPAAITDHARRFSPEHFDRAFMSLTQQALRN